MFILKFLPGILILLYEERLEKMMCFPDLNETDIKTNPLKIVVG